MVDNFSQGWNFKSLNRNDEILSRMLSDSNNRITIIGNKFITVNRAEISARFEQTKLKFWLHINEFKIIIAQVNSKQKNKLISFKRDDEIENLKLAHLQ